MPERTSEPINRKLTVSCPLFSTWLLPDASIVENGTRVLIEDVRVDGGDVVFLLAGARSAWGSRGQSSGEDSSVAVGLKGMGWKGVGVGEAFGAAVTNMNGKAAC